MFTVENDKNPIRIFTVVFFVVLASLAFYLHIGRNWSLSTAFSLIGIVCNVVGTLWIASGVYVLGKDKTHLVNGKASRSKLVKHLANLMESASRITPIGIIYVLVGGFFQAIVLIGNELRWFNG